MSLLRPNVNSVSMATTLSIPCGTGSLISSPSNFMDGNDKISARESNSPIKPSREDGNCAEVESDMHYNTNSNIGIKDHLPAIEETGALSPRKKEKLILKCTWHGCKKVFHKTRHLEDHYRSHTGERPFTCDYQGCYKSYTKKEHLKRHQQNHKPGTPRFSCPQCNQSYSLRANLTRHINRTHDEARFQCTDCEMSFKKNWQLKSHLNKTHGGKPFVCTYEGCEREFAKKLHCDRHMKLHKGYDCKVEGCDAHCDTWSLMRQHVAMSHNEHKCQTCGKSFPAAQYRAHLKQHKKQRESFLCTYKDCHKAYFDEKNLNTHIKVCHKEGKHECTQEGCQAKLVSKQKLKEHMTKIHDPTYVLKAKVKQKKKKKNRMEKQRKERAVKEVMNILLKRTEVKICATTRREFEGYDFGSPEQEVSLQVVNDPRRPSLMEVVSADIDNELCNETSEYPEESDSSRLGLSFANGEEEDSGCSEDHLIQRTLRMENL